MIEFISFGEFLIDMVATARNVSLYDAPAFEPKPGGAPANVAVGLARLDRKVAFISRVGADDFGVGLRAVLDREGIDMRGLSTDPAALTTIALVSLSDSGSPSFAFFAGAHSTLSAGELPIDLLRSTRVFHFSSVTLAHEPVRTATYRAIEIAKQSGAIISYDVNWRPMLYPDKEAGRATIQTPIQHADILKMSESELTFITGIDDVPQALATLLDRSDVTARLIAVTMGEEGCLYALDRQIDHVPSISVEHVADATGAGDSFMAALLDGLTTGVDDGLNLDVAHVRRVVERACQSGAIATQTRGAIPSLPRRDQLPVLQAEAGGS